MADSRFNSRAWHVHAQARKVDPAEEHICKFVPSGEFLVRLCKSALNAALFTDCQLASFFVLCAPGMLRQHAARPCSIQIHRLGRSLLG